MIADGARSYALGTASLGLLSSRVLDRFEAPVLTEVPPPPVEWALPLSLHRTATTVATLLPSGFVHLVEYPVRPEADEPNVLWFLLQEAGSPSTFYTTYCVGLALPPFNASLTGSIAPYQTFATSPPNPNFAPGQIPLARKWILDTTYYVRVPQGVAGLGGNPFGITSGYSYTYQEFLWDVAFTVAKYSASAPTAGHLSLPPLTGPGAYPGHPNGPALPAQMGSPYVSRTAQFGGLTDPNQCPPNSAVGVAPSGGTIWPRSPATFPVNAGSTYFSGVFPDSVAISGPTGDQVNEFLWLVPPTPVTALPLGAPAATSMVVDVFSGAIVEADVVFDPNTSLWPTRSSGNGPSANCPVLNVNGQYDPPAGVPLPGPGWTTVFDHEVGHFFGLHHSNLYPGLEPPIGTGVASACDLLAGSTNLNPALTSAVGPAAPCGTKTPANVQTYAEVPGMAMIVGRTNYWRTSPNAALHPDDEFGVAELNPVTVPGQNPGYSNVMINDFARIEGSVGFVTATGTKKVFGMNVFPLPHDCDYEMTTLPVDCAYPPCPTTNVGTTCAPRVGKISGTARLAAHSVIGYQDTSTSPSVPTSGEFQIHGVAPSTDYYVKIEPLEMMGFYTHAFQNPSFAVRSYFGKDQFGEWFYDLNGNYGAVPPTVAYPESGNPPMTWMGPTQTPGTVAPLHQLAGYPTGLLTCEQVLLERRPFATSLGSLYCAPGTVITLNVDLNRGRVHRETVSRPVVQIAPRFPNWQPTGFNIAVTVTHDYQLNLARCYWNVNGTSIPAGTPLSTTQPTPIAGTGPWTTTWGRSSTALGVTPGSRLRFEAQELPAITQQQPPTWRVPAGITATVGVNEVQY